VSFVRVSTAPEAGFSLLEVVVALALAMAVAVTAAALISPSANAFGAAPEQADMQQRVRGSVDALQRDLSMAGAGPYFGDEAGSLSGSFAPVIPRRIGIANPDAVTVARPDAVTITYVPNTYLQTSASAPVSPGMPMSVAAAANCATGLAMCGLQAGSTIALFDRTAHFDVFTVTSVSGGTAQIRAHVPVTTYTYPAGTRVVQAESKTYYLDASSNQLRVYDGYQTDVPVVDNVVSLAFEYFGDPNPPIAPRPPAGTANCLYDASGDRLAMPVLGSNPTTVVSLPLSMLSDGPWCGSGGTTFDADLLRIRGIRVTASVQATLAAFRSASALFVRPGWSRTSGRSLPDLTLSFTVWPPNLSTRS
jgi:hypothetical protein